MEVEMAVVHRSNTCFTPENARLMAQRSVEAKRQRKLNLARIAAESVDERGPEPLDNGNVVDATVNRAGKTVKRRLVNELLRQSAILEANPPTTIKELKNGRIKSVQGIVENSARLFGWGKTESEPPLLRIGTVERLALVTDKPGSG